MERLQEVPMLFSLISRNNLRLQLMLVPSQEWAGGERPVTSASICLTYAKIRYSVLERNPLDCLGQGSFQALCFWEQCIRAADPYKG